MTSHQGNPHSNPPFPPTFRCQCPKKIRLPLVSKNLDPIEPQNRSGAGHQTTGQHNAGLPCEV